MNIWIKISVIVCISILFVTCSENTTESAVTDSKITGTVTDTNGNLLHGVDIYLVYQLIDIPLHQPVEVANPDTVSLVYFKATKIGRDIRLDWQTSSEVNNRGFDIQRKTEKTEYEEIGFVAGFGTSTKTNSYSFVDGNLALGQYAYRLKQIDFDGTYNFSPEVEITTFLVLDTLYQNYPNPFPGITSIQYTLRKQAICKLEIKNYYNAESLVVLVNEEQSAGIYTVSFNNDIGLTNNIYSVNFIASSGGETDYEQDITILLNENNIIKISESQPFIKTVNGNFEIKLSDLPINKTINNTLESPEIIKQQIISNLLKFVLFKDGYNVLEAAYLLDLNSQNEFNFVMEKQ
ncbi:MAG: hypothetical protein BMS9Abin39_0823 [Ignavibacteria bacterium]|nr:MAG: hypothetical protein BMS9Abin39_0823 [Ignavibacteria bacterium]